MTTDKPVKTIKFDKLPLARHPGKRQYYWFSAEYFEDGVLKTGRGCAFSDTKQVDEIKEEFEKKVKQ